MISVCMGTYQGERFIHQQLQTILEQSQPPDEVIICDDNSTDNTVNIVRDFIDNHNLQDKWKLYQNKENKGYPGNFYYAMSLCRGDVVFLSDQDDIWHKEKIEKFCEIFEKNGGSSVVCCKYGLIDEEGKRIHSVMQTGGWAEKEIIRQFTVKQIFNKYQWPGMAMAYRREWFHKKWSQTDGDIGIPHDFLICMWAAEENAFLRIEKEFVCHRRHDNNVGKEEHRLSRLLIRERKLLEIEEYINILQEFEEKELLSTKEGRVTLLDKKASMLGRYEALESGKLGKVLINAWKSRKYVRMGTVICDMVITLKGRRK